MKVPSWFVIGCGLLILNAFVVFGGALTRHATAEPPAANASKQAEGSEIEGLDDSESKEESSAPLTAASADLAPSLPEVPSLDELPKTQADAGVLSIEDFKQVFSEQSNSELSDELPSEQLSHSYFDALKLRLKSVEFLTKSSQSLVDEAAILFKRGEAREAQKLIGMATQLREMAATLLVTRQ